jgi:hypothetical protein
VEPWAKAAVDAAPNRFSRLQAVLVSGAAFYFSRLSAAACPLCGSRDPDHAADPGPGSVANPAR